MSRRSIVTITEIAYNDSVTASSLKRSYFTARATIDMKWESWRSSPDAYAAS
jgi:hypothetical protein